MKDSLGRENRKISDLECFVCSKIFRPPNSRQKTCSKICGYKNRKITPHNKGKGKGWINSKGYREIRINGKTTREHRFIMENFLGRKLLPNEDVHHINGIKHDNRIENLQVINHSEHSKITNKRTYKKGYKMNISDEERKRRSEKMKETRLKQSKKH